jgi:hypothetical protein
LGTGVFSDGVTDHEFESLPRRLSSRGGVIFQAVELTNKIRFSRNSSDSLDWANFALEMSQKPLRFVQRGRILLRCGSAFALSLPSLGVSSLDLGRLFIQAALFSY